jgi:hypothetical protein
MDWGYKAVLTTMCVAVVLMTAQHVGCRFAGLIAGLPVIAAPFLLWIAAAQGAAFAARCAVGSVAACGAAAVFALIYERAARRHGVAASMAAALAGGGGVALCLARLTVGEGGLPIALVAAAALCAAALIKLPVAVTTARPTRRLRGELRLTAALAGGVCAVVALWSPLLGPFGSGLLASLPLISSAALVHQHLTAPHEDRQRFLRGYATGLVGKTAFAAVFTVGAAQLGSGLAMALAVATTVAVSLGLVGCLRPLKAAAGAGGAAVSRPRA